jgi:hypothetical protein
MIYLIVGLDRRTLAPWHENIHGRDLTTATQVALARAGAEGLDLVVAAVIGPNSTVLADRASEQARRPKAARQPKAARRRAATATPRASVSQVAS